ncbi:MAG: helix-turn-helix domain-containing protein [Clostridia bacterium]|nr:helix-turn-helix domain-containing protein [Clostridia bacterium]
MPGVLPIERYILFLKRECGLSVSLHPMEEENLITPSNLMVFNIHDNSHCVFVKSHENAARRCAEGQRRVAARCNGGSFCGTCHAGVTEYVYPIRREGKSIGFISVSGYGTEEGKKRLPSAAAAYGIDPRALSETFRTLKSALPPKAQVDTLLHPLVAMLELAYTHTVETPCKTLSEKVMQYVKAHRHSTVTLGEISKHLSFSPSHVSHTFKKETGRSIPAYLTELRLSDACSLLQSSSLSVTEIALSVGFSDANYFSMVFKRSLGVSPLEYKKKSLLP